MSSVDLKDFLAAYLAETDEHLQAANANLLAIEASLRKGESAPRAVRDLFRALHTIKGLSAMVGIEEVVAVSHRMETVLRAADRAAGAIPAPAIDVLLQGVRSIEHSVRALAAQKPVPKPSTALLEALDALESVGPLRSEADASALVLEDDIGKKINAGERAQIVAGLRAGKRAVRVDFVPSVERSAAGLTINSVRIRLTKVAEIVKVVPLSRAVTAEAPGGLVFALILLTNEGDAQIAEAAGAEPGSVVSIGQPPATTSLAPGALDLDLADDDDRATPDAPRRNVLRVDVARVDDAMERLSALIVTRSRLGRAVADLSATGANTTTLVQIMNDHARQVRDLRGAILRVRMVPVSDVLERVPLIVRGLRRSSGKAVKLHLDTSQAELDKAVAERVFPAIVHLVRNAVDHGIELPAERVSAGKPEEGTLRITCGEQSSSRLEIVIADDGGGIDRVAVARKAGTDVPATDEALLEILCRPGLSTRSEVTTTSGRGMGMDIVKRIVVDQLGGELAVQTAPGRGTTFTLRVPLTVSIVDAFTLECAGQRFVVPVSMVEELVEVEPDKVIYGPTAVTGVERRGVGMLQRRGEAVPLVELAIARRLGRPKERARKALVVRRAGEPIAFGLDRVLGQQEAVVRPLEDPLVQVPGIAGATDLGDGRPTLVLDLLSLGARLSELGTERVA